MIVQREISMMSDFLTKLFISTEKPALLCKKIKCSLVFSGEIKSEHWPEMRLVYSKYR